MAMERNIGIAVAGTVIVDKINEISAYPNPGELTQIRSIQNAVGGCVPNVGLDLKKIAPELPSKNRHRVGVILLCKINYDRFAERIIA